MDKVLVTNASFAKYSDRAMQILQDAGLEIVRAKQPVRSDVELIEYLDGVVAIITGLEPITKKVIDSAPRLKVVAKHGIGVDNIDLDAAKKKGVTVVNAPGANREAVADLVFGLMISLARKIPEADRSVRTGEWPKVFGASVWGRTLGIIGLGAIGKSVAKRAEGFDMTVLAFDTFWDEEYASANEIRRATVDEILAESDFVTLHVPLIDSTRNLINRDRLKLMKPTAYLINAARGGVVDEEALYEMLKNKQIAGAALDAFTEEPPVGSPLLKLDNVIVTPHMGGFTDSALGQTSEFTARAVVEVLQGKKPKCIIV